MLRWWVLRWWTIRLALKGSAKVRWKKGRNPHGVNLGWVKRWSYWKSSMNWRQYERREKTHTSYAYNCACQWMCPWLKAHYLGFSVSYGQNRHICHRIRTSTCRACRSQGKHGVVVNSLFKITVVLGTGIFVATFAAHAARGSVPWNAPLEPQFEIVRLFINFLLARSHLTISW